jgi:myosin-5
VLAREAERAIERATYAIRPPCVPAGPDAMTQHKAWKEDGLEGWARGSRVWLRAGRDDWQPATLQSAGGAGDAPWRVALDSPLGPGTGAVVDVSPSQLVPANPALLEGSADLTHLSFLNEPSVLHALHQRYTAEHIYTHAGPVLVAVNPFRALPGLYSDAAAAHYKARPHLEVTDGYAPHVFLTADKAYKQVGG